MKPLKKSVLLTVLALIFALNGGLKLPPQGEPVFGVCVSYQGTGGFYQYVAYLQSSYGINSKRTLREDEFIKFVSGYWPSIYNPTKIDHFSNEGLYCGVLFDSLVWKEYPLCSPMDSLWKIRYRGYPFQNSNDIGWANNDFRPSSNQEKYLYREFGIKNIDRDFFVDTSFWKLLRCVSNPNWIESYKNIQ
ncbi:MAG: hypothetical protein ACI9VN_003672 [Patescibacteria group bacterium]|jgi:hypothetical protein